MICSVCSPLFWRGCASSAPCLPRLNGQRPGACPARAHPMPTASLLVHQPITATDGLQPFDGHAGGAAAGRKGTALAQEGCTAARTYSGGTQEGVPASRGRSAPGCKGAYLNADGSMWHAFSCRETARPTEWRRAYWARVWGIKKGHAYGRGQRAVRAGPCTGGGVALCLPQQALQAHGCRADAGMHPVLWLWAALTSGLGQAGQKRRQRGGGAASGGVAGVIARGQARVAGCGAEANGPGVRGQARNEGNIHNKTGGGISMAAL
jgi:hypothetical protein